MSKEPTDMGMNRTGLQASPIDSQKVVDSADLIPPDVDLTTSTLLEERIEASTSADPVGTMPLPGSVKGALDTAISALAGHKMNVFLDAVGERLAFERTGTRLYQALAAKHAASDHPLQYLSEIESIRDDELAHFQILSRAMTRMGGDPTAMTPSADIAAQASAGAIKVLTDPKTTFTEACKTMLTIELSDNEGWSQLINLAQEIDSNDLVQEFTACMLQEQLHLQTLRRWVTRAVSGQLNMVQAPNAQSDKPNGART